MPDTARQLQASGPAPETPDLPTPGFPAPGPGNDIPTPPLERPSPADLPPGHPAPLAPTPEPPQV